MCCQFDIQNFLDHLNTINNDDLITQNNDDQRAGFYTIRLAFEQ